MRSRPQSWLSTLTQLGFTRKRRRDSRQHRTASRTLRLESLEPRQLLAITVMNINDNGTGSLRHAIADATPGETIDFDSMLSGETIELLSQLNIIKSVTIDATALTDGLILDAGNGMDDGFATGDGFRIFNIDDLNISTDIDVTLRGLKITGGDVGPDVTVGSHLVSAGGAILNRENLTIVDSDISGNAAVENVPSGGAAGQAYGGAIFSDGPSLDISGTTLRVNKALVDSSNREVLASGNVLASKGGAIFATSGDLMITDSVISGNQALSDASGVQEEAGSIQGGTLGFAFGGGIYSAALGGMLQIATSTIASNTARFTLDGANSDGTGDSRALGGGLAIVGLVFASNSRTINIEESTISRNHAVIDGFFDGESPSQTAVDALGGGIQFTIPSGPSVDIFKIVSSTISGNIAELDLPGPLGGIEVSTVLGAGIHASGNFYGTFEIRHSTIAENEVRNVNTATSANGQDFDGGGIFNALVPTAMSLDHVIVSDNTVVGVAGDITNASGASTQDSFSFIGGDPDIEPLANNGGPTQTHALNCGSLALDAGNPAAMANMGTVPEFDQRGMPRIFDVPGVSNGAGGEIDIGAYELSLKDLQALAADFDNDMDVDGADFLKWQQGFGMMSGAVKGDGDADGDGDVDEMDLKVWSEQFGDGTSISADFDTDGDVDGDDLEMWQESFGIDAGGDADGDLDTDGADFLAWQAQFAQEMDCHQWAMNILAHQQLQPGEILVSTTRDENDGDYSLGDLSLREALVIAASTTATDVITFAADVRGELFLTGGQLDIDSHVDIVGPGANQLTINGNDASRVFNVQGVTNAMLEGLTITGGNVTGTSDGGGIFNAGHLVLDSVVVVDNHSADSGGGVYTEIGTLIARDSTFELNTATNGGGIFAATGEDAEVDISNSTFYANSADNGAGVGSGGGAFFSGGEGPGLTTIYNSTFSGNDAAEYNGGIRMDDISWLKIVNTTITNNTAQLEAGGISALGGSVATLHNSIVSGNTAPSNADATGTFVSTSSFNLVGITNSADLNDVTDGNISGVTNPMLAPLADNGGVTKTHAPLAGSQAIDAGDIAETSAAGLTLDQRGVNRHFYDPASSDGVDIGAVEQGLIVTVANDENDATFNRADLSLREALAVAKGNFDLVGVANRIEFDPSLSSPLAVTLGLLLVDSDVHIAGPGASQLTIDATGGNSRVFKITSTATVEMSGLTITGGNEADDGGGIFNQGDLTLKSVVVTGNTAGDLGGGIYTTGPLRVEKSSIDTNTALRSAGIFATLSGSEEFTILNSTVSHNTTTGGNGGGILLKGTDNAQIINSTISNNTGGYGGGIRVLTSTTKLDIINSTITENVAAAGAGGIHNPNDATVTLHNTILAGNTGSTTSHDGLGDLSGMATELSSFNLVGIVNGSGLTSGVEHNILGVTDPGLGALADHGGTGQTHALLDGGQEIDAGSDATALAFGLLRDQRGKTRFDDGELGGFASADIGAFELGADEFFGILGA